MEILANVVDSNWIKTALCSFETNELLQSRSVMDLDLNFGISLFSKGCTDDDNHCFYVYSRRKK